MTPGAIRTTFEYMRRFFIIQAALLLVVVFSFATHDSQAYPFPIAIPSVDLIYPVIESQLFTPRDLPGSELTNQGRNVRGIYLPLGVVVTTKPEKLVRWVKEHVHANAVIIDVKDDSTHSETVNGIRFHVMKAKSQQFIDDVFAELEGM